MIQTGTPQRVNRLKGSGGGICNMIELVRKRRSIRTYTKEQVDRQTVDLLIETLLRGDELQYDKVKNNLYTEQYM